jgi:hypothetical protein
MAQKRKAVTLRKKAAKKGAPKKKAAKKGAPKKKAASKRLYSVNAVANSAPPPRKPKKP